MYSPASALQFITYVLMVIHEGHETKKGVCFSGTGVAVFTVLLLFFSIVLYTS